MLASCPRHGCCHLILRHTPSFLPAPPAPLQLTKCPAAAASAGPGLLLPNSLRRLLSHGPNEHGQGPSGMFLGRLTIFITFVPIFLLTHGVCTSPCCHPKNLATSWAADLTPDKVPCDSTGSLWGWRDLRGAESSLLRTSSTHGSSKPPADPLCGRGAELPHSCLSPVPVLLTGRQSPSKKGVTPKLESDCKGLPAAPW